MKLSKEQLAAKRARFYVRPVLATGRGQGAALDGASERRLTEPARLCRHTEAEERHERPRHRPGCRVAARLDARRTSRPANGRSHGRGGF